MRGRVPAAVGVGIVGAGRMGQIRARSVARHRASRVVMVADVRPARARVLAEDAGSEWTADWEQVVSRADVDAVIVATTHNHLAPIVTAALDAGKHVFCEKPMARNPEEAEAVLDGLGRSANAERAPGGRAGPSPVLVVGYTLRHHASLDRARALVRGGAIGEPLYVRGRYGHGGRPGYEREWRADPAISGGGELLDQGVHLIDLSRWFLGEFQEALGFVAAYVWLPETAAPGASADVSGPAAEDNAFLLLRTAEGRVASLHASWTEWKNLFSFEIFGRDGFLTAEGLGGSYGPERLFLGRRRPGAPPDLEERRFDDAGASQWDREWAAFIRAVESGPASDSPSATGFDAFQTLLVVQAAYRAHCDGQSVPLATSQARGS